MRRLTAMTSLALLAACGAANADQQDASSFLATLGAACKPVGLDRGCEVVAAGLLNNGPDGKRLYWQVQDGASSTDGVGGAVVVFSETGDGKLEPIVSDTEAWRYEAPMLIRDGDAPLLLVAPGTSRGTSASPIVLAWEWRDRTWKKIDSDAWHGEAEALLGKDTIQNGFRIDFENMLGVTPLWRTGDGHCCPSGGWALISFELRDGALHVTDAVARPAAPT